MEPNIALFFYDEKGVQCNALLKAYYPSQAGKKADKGGGKDVEPLPERVDLVYVTAKGQVQTETGVVRRGAGVAEKCFKVRG